MNKSINSKSLNPPQSIEFDLSHYLTHKRDILDGYLKKIIQGLDRNRELIRAMEHSLMAGGKRLRPVLAMAAAEAVGGDFRLALPAACAIEMIHTYSLVHDDLPGMDNDDLRRGMPTCHKAFSEATAILAGDALLTHAFSLLTNPWTLFDPYPDKTVLFDLVSMISRAAGANGMVEGQMMDMLAPSLFNENQGRNASCPICPRDIEQQVHGVESEQPLTQQSTVLQSQDKGQSIAPLDYLTTLHELKTGRMIMVSVEAGAVSAGAAPEQIALLSGYSGKIGLAFQVTDDILNVEGDPEIMGKAAGSDELNDKMTFPALLGLDASKQYARQLIQEALEQLDSFHEKAMPLRAIAQYILERNR